MTRCRRSLGALLAASLLAGVPATSQAGLRNFVDSFVGLLDQTNTSMSAAGDKLKAGLKEGKVKQAMSDFDAGLKEAEAQMAPKRAAVWESLKDLPMWIPQAIHNTWKQFVGALKKVVGVLLPGNGGGGDQPPANPPPADPPPADPPPADPPPADPPPGDGEGDKPPADDGADAGPDEPGEEDAGDDAGGEEPPADAPPADEPPAGEDDEEPASEPEAEVSSAAETPVDPAPDGDADQGEDEYGEAPTSRASADMWEAAKQGFRDADRDLQFETYGRLGALLAAEQGKQARGREKGVLTERASKVLLGKLDEVRELHGWMAQHLAEVLAGGQGIEALETQLKALGPKASQRSFGPVVREARRRSQARSLEAQGPAAPNGTAARLSKVLGWMGAGAR